MNRALEEEVEAELLLDTEEDRDEAVFGYKLLNAAVGVCGEYGPPI